MSLKRFAIFIIILSLLSWLFVSKLFFEDHIVEIFLGMIAPLIIGLSTVFTVKSIYLKNPTKLTSFMIKSFGGKMILYGLYIFGIATFSTFDARKFLVSFIVYFSALHMLEALFIRAVFRGMKT